MMDPGIRPGESPPFHKLGEYIFEELCRDLFDAEPCITTCYNYGTRGQAQDGIDLLAHRVGGDGIEVGQCKCCATFSVAQIRNASREFFDHWDHWSECNVKRFILFVACDLSRTQQQNEILRQKNGFADHGIEYEAWSAAKIRNKLRPHRAIVGSYCKPSEHWIREICGETQHVPATTGDYRTEISVVEYQAIVSQLARFSSRLSGELEGRLDRMRTAWREGRRKEAKEGLQSIKGDPDLWSTLSPQDQAAVLRFEASLELSRTGNLFLVRQLADHAHALASSEGDARIRALIACREAGPEAAAELLYNQHDVDSLNLRAAFLFESGELDESWNALQAKVSDVEPNAESLRLRALLYLSSKDVSHAQSSILKALELQPRWTSIRFTYALIDYFSALSPAALPDRIARWPEPVDWIHVRRDDESLMRLRGAADVFQELIEETENTKEEEHTLAVWRLACLANDPERQEEAIASCRKILEEDPTHFSAISWAAARSFEIDLDTSERALKKRVVDGSAEIPDILALITCYLTSQKPGVAAQLLRETKPVFLRDHAGTLWSSWHARLLAITGEPEAAIRAIDKSESKAELAQARAIALWEVAKKTGDWSRLLQYLESSYEETGDPNYLYECCEVMAQEQHWDYVAERAEELIEGLGTAEALRLAAIAACNARRFSLCLGLLEDHQEFFSQRKLPSELRRIRALCKQALGDLRGALKEAEALSEEEPTLDNTLTVAGLHFAVGDLKGLAVVARQLICWPDLPTEASLGVARLVQREDQEVARELWANATSRDLPDSLIGEALTLGFQLGLDKKLGPLFARVEAQGTSDIQMLTIDDLILFEKERRDRTVEFNDAYRRGTVPIHLGTELLSLSLADLYRRLLVENEAVSAPTRQRVLLARHGGRALVSGFPDVVPDWHLNLDVTAVLLAEHLQILTQVEEVFRPIRVPMGLITALVQMREKAAHHQPSRLRACQQIIELAENDILEVVTCDVPQGHADTQMLNELGEEWVALFQDARANKGYLVDFHPLRIRDLHGPPSVLLEGAHGCVVNCRAIVEALREQGPLSAKEYCDALKQLGSEGHGDTSNVVPHEGSPLYCYANIPEVLAVANLLRIVCDRFQVRIEARELQRVNSELEEHKRSQAVAEWLSDLIDRISKGIRKGTFELIPNPPDNANDLKEAAAGNPDMGCLEHVVTFEAREGDVVWVDDRCVNSHLFRDGADVVGISEVLKSLVAANVLDIDEYYDINTRLRASNVRFIPVEGLEILHHLQQARIENQVVVETRDLSVLRRYVAACLLQGEMLQRPPLPDNSPNKQGEIAFVTGIGRAIADALVAIWANSMDDEPTCWARSEWLLANLYLDYLGLCTVATFPNPDENDRYLVAITFTGLISQAITIETGHESGIPSERRMYFDWLFDRLLRKRIEADPGLLAMIVDVLRRQMIDSALEKTSNEIPQAAVVQVLQGFHWDLPKPIREELLRDAEYGANIGLRPVISVEGLHFDQDDFWWAASEALNGRAATLCSLESDREVALEPVADKGQYALRFDHPTTGKKGTVRGARLRLLRDSLAEREATLREHRHWFDCPDEVFDQIVLEITALENPRQRMEQFESWISSSTGVFYRELHRKLSEQASFQSFAFLPPSPEGLLWYFGIPTRLEPGRAFGDAFATAAQSLAHELGLSTAILRLSGLPVPLPEPLVEAVAELSREERHSLVRRLLRAARSPIHKLHLVHLLLQHGDGTPAFGRLSRWISKSLLTAEGAEEVEAFLAILGWVSDEFSCWHEARSQPAHARLALAWSHTSQIFSILTSLGVPLTWLRDSFGQMQHPSLFETFQYNLDYWLDVAHPRQLRTVTFVLAGLSYSLGDKAPELIDRGLQNALAAQAFFEVEGTLQLRLPLMRDTTNARNSLGSFLGGDRAETLSPLIGTENAGQLSHQALQALVQQALDTIAEGRFGANHWLLLHVVLGDMPPCKALVDQLKGILLQTDFVDLFERDVQLGIIAVQFASLQVVNVDDEEIRLHLEDKCLKIARLFADTSPAYANAGPESEDQPDGQETICGLLLDLALNASRVAEAPERYVAGFGDLVMQLVETWPLMLPMSRLTVQHLCEHLPVSQAKLLWPVLIRLRAE